MKLIEKIILFISAGATSIGLATSVSAQTYQGTSSKGEIVNLYENTIQRLDKDNIQFTYSIGRDTVSAIANCSNGTIRSTNNSFPTYQPNPIGATRTMYNSVCNYLYKGNYSERPIQQRVLPIYRSVAVVNIFNNRIFSTGTGVLFNDGSVVAHDGYRFNLRDSIYWGQFQCVSRSPNDMYCVGN